MFLKESEFLARMEDTVLPYLAARRSEPPFTADDGTPLYVALYRADAPRGTVVLLHGFSENTEKYREFIYYLLQQDLSVLSYDHRGHGRSHRTADVSVMHVRRFADYVSDLEALLRALSPSLRAPLYLFAHSMGGAIATLYLEKNPTVFEKAILSAPMISLRYRGIGRAGAMLACRFCALTGRAQKRVFISRKGGRGDRFETSSALSRARYEYLYALRQSDPRLRGGAPSYAWSLTALGVTKKLLARGAPERVHIPVRIYAAEHEHLVDPDAQKALVRRLPQGELRLVHGSKHEILFANDERLHPILAEILAFYS